MVVDGLRRDEQLLGDLRVGVSVGDEAEDVVLAAGQAQRMLAGGGARAGGDGADAQAAQGAARQLRAGGGAEVGEDAVGLVQQLLLARVEQRQAGVVRAALGGYDFINQASGACLNAFIKAENGAPFGLSSCRSVSNERFDTATLPNVTSVESRIGGSDNGFCMDVPGGSSQLGLQVQLWTCNGSLAQRWVIGFA